MWSAVAASACRLQSACVCREVRVPGDGVLQGVAGCGGVAGKYEVCLAVTLGGTHIPSFSEGICKAPGGDRRDPCVPRS